MAKRRASLFIDQSNLHYALDWRINHKKLLTRLQQDYEIVKAFYYEGKRPLKYYERKNPELSFQERVVLCNRKDNFFKHLKLSGYIVRTKAVKYVYDNTEGVFKGKCNFDIELAIDAIDTLDEYEVMILISGDGDFLKLVKYLKSKFKKVHIIAPKKRCDHNLRKSANKFEYINLLRKEIEQ